MRNLPSCSGGKTNGHYNHGQSNRGQHYQKDKNSITPTAIGRGSQCGISVRLDPGG
jgi:hypothetical protein